MVQELLAGDATPPWVDWAALLGVVSLLLLLWVLERRRRRAEFLREVTRCQHAGCERWLSRRAMTKVPAGERAWSYWCPEHGAARLDAGRAGVVEADVGGGELRDGEGSAAALS